MESILEMLKEREDLKQTEKYVKDKLAEIDAVIKEAVPPDCIGTFEDEDMEHVWNIRNMATTRKGVDAQRLKAEFPDVYAQVQTETQYTRLTINKIKKEEAK